MIKTVSATEARVHFGEMLRHVATGRDTIIVEKSGRPQMVLISIAEYERLKDASLPRESWWEQLRQARDKIATELAGRDLPPADEIIRKMREERDAQLLDLR